MCIGAPKSGTTWLYQILNQHPDIFIPKEKELHYFNALHPETYLPNQNFSKDIAWYHSFFKDSKSAMLTADFSTSYLADPDMAQKLFQYNPNLKILIMLRNPVARAWSHFSFLQSRGMLRSNNFFEESKRNQSILNAGHYANRIEVLIQQFTASQVKILFYEELNEPEKLIQSVIEFLQLPNFSPEGLHQKVNATKLVKSTALHEIVTFIKHSLLGKVLNKLKMNNLLIYFYNLNAANQAKNEVPEEIEAYLRNYYKEDIKKLNTLLDKKIWNP